MKKLSHIVQLGLINPRFYIEALDLKWRSFRRLATFTITIMSIFLTLSMIPYLRNIQQNISSAKEVIPAYTIEQQQLKLATDAKPVYYHSAFFQLVVDDTIVAQGSDTNIPLAASKAQQIDTNTQFGLFLFKDQVFTILGGSLFKLDNFYSQYATREALVALLGSINDTDAQLIGFSFIGAFITSIVLYWLLQFVVMFLANVFNRRLTQKLTRGQRLKLSIAISFVPIIVVELFNLLFPSLAIGLPMVAMLTLYIMYLMLKSHTEFVSKTLADLSEVIQDVQQHAESDDTHNNHSDTP